MTYKETTDWMFSQLPMFQTQGASAYKNNLSNTHLLMDHLQHPQQRFKSVHVAGTNGKGSTSSMLASILQEAGYKVGLYTSPHLKDFRERIRINGSMISEDFVIDFIANNKIFFEDNQLSFFEMTVGLAFDYFATEAVDVALIEVGMGGRLDATNIITPLVSVITNIGFDHTQFLGDTLTKIAFEKAGIIKPRVPVVIGAYTSETKLVFQTTAEEANATIYYAKELPAVTYPCGLLGNYQEHNKKTVLQTVLLLQSEFLIDENHLKLGFKNVVQNTGLQGRWEILKQHPFVVCDTAHNSQGLKMVLSQIQTHQYDALHVVFGVVNDKDLASILPLFPKTATYYFCCPKNLRGLAANLLQREAATYGLHGAIYESVPVAYAAALSNACSNDFVFVGGSTFVVAEIV